MPMRDATARQHEPITVWDMDRLSIENDELAEVTADGVITLLVERGAAGDTVALNGNERETLDDALRIYVETAGTPENERERQSLADGLRARIMHLAETHQAIV